MKSRYFFPLLLIAAVAASAAGYWVQQQKRSVTLSTMVATQRPDFQLPDLQGRIRKNSEWDGKIVVVNFWATWCPPCVEEIPIFVEFQKKYEKQGVQFIGIAIDELEAVQRFADKLKINYPILVDMNQAIEISRKFGNDLGALPFTAIVNQQGKVILQHRGDINRQQLEKTILPLLQPSV